MHVSLSNRNRNRSNILQNIPSFSSKKYKRVGLSPCITRRSVKKNQHEILLNYIFEEKNLNECSNKQNDLVLQGNIIERERLLKNMHNVIVKFNYSQATYHLAIYLIDLIQKKGNSKLLEEELALGCLFLAIKFNGDLKNYSFFKLTQAAFCSKLFYSNEQLKKFEITCLKLLDYNLAIVTPFIALKLIILRGVVFSDDVSNESLKKLKTFLLFESKALLEIVIKKTYLYEQFNPFIFSLSIICLTRQKNGLSKWNEMFTFLYSIKENDIEYSYCFLNEVLSEKYTDRIRERLKNINYQPIRRKEIKVNTSINFHPIRTVSTSKNHRTIAIDSFYRKSQRSTSASLEDSPNANRNNSIQMRIKMNKSINQLKKKLLKNTRGQTLYETINEFSSIESNQNETIAASFASRPNIFNKNNLTTFRKNNILPITSINLQKTIMIPQKAPLPKNNDASKEKNIISANITSQIMNKKLNKRITTIKENLKKAIISKELNINNFRTLNPSLEYPTSKKHKKISSFIPILKRITGKN